MSDSAQSSSRLQQVATAGEGHHGAPQANVSGWALWLEALRGSEQDFARLELRKAIPLLAIPMVLEMAMEAVFAIVDVFFVSKLGPDAIATVGLTESLVTLVYALGIGIAMPVTAMVARRVGEGDRKAASHVAGQALLIGLGLGLAIGLPAPWVAGSLLQAMGAEPAVVAGGGGYAAVMLGTNAVIMLLFILNAVFRGAGDAARAMRALWIANGINIVLDPCLIFGWGPFPELGVTGAAVATAIGRGVGVLYQIRALMAGPRLRLDLDALRPAPRIIGNILRLSVGGVGQYLIGTASWIVLVRILAGFGSEVVAGYTVAIRIVIFVLLPSWGFANATSTLVGQSLGADDPARAERAVLYSGLYNMAFLGLVSLVLIAWPEAVAGLLTQDPAVLHHASRGLMIISFGYVFYAWEMVLVNAFNGAGDTRTPSLVNLVAFWAVEIPLGWFLSHALGWGPDGVFVAIAVAYSLAAVIAYLAFRRGRWKEVRV
ncbi:MATE family efflux transporter [Paraliomyxa miuraensis]|uniref:MATE family efflux transporter n=1 Tax=Paraliomyxa miuraensis TaxID=376150 RepID=UPI002259FE63|nr:MATE family efflux transporter [Paraliomyxa miuraensis]MCX4244745.1 MATE family efflux transporter [Paraliomyxa miuraensis]